MKHAGRGVYEEERKRKERESKYRVEWRRTTVYIYISSARHDSSLYLSNSQTDEQPLKYLQITGLPKDVFPLASKTKGNPPPPDGPVNQSIWHAEILIDAKRQPPSIIVISFRYAFDERKSPSGRRTELKAMHLLRRPSVPLLDDRDFRARAESDLLRPRN